VQTQELWFYDFFSCNLNILISSAVL
jgi:hypothetical protein